VRRIQKFAKFHVFADVAIGVTVLVIVVYTFFFYTQQGELSRDVVRINYDNYLVFFGTSIYVFEGIGIVLPVKDSVQNPERYKYILTGMMFFLVVILIAFGLFNYLVYGAEMLKDAPLITRILPAGKYPIEGAMLLFIVNLFITFPLVIHPANMVIESYLYKGMKQSMTRKWVKNFTRTLLVAITIVIGLWLEESLDRLMSLVGSLACTPVAFIMPAVFHLKLVAETPWVKAFDWFILIIGFVLLFFMTSNTLLTWSK
jgi:proton-coupled amino acid transporter